MAGPRKSAPKQVTIHEAKTHLSRLLKRVEQGEEIVIAHGLRPVARLLPIEARARPRIGGEYRGEIWIAPDFDAPLPRDREDDFYK